ncbi:MAG TPA: ABC transporter permease [Trueperaceae bacterium]|nr:ABC transporter permease [Trueperaceae bacterium]
MLAFLLRRLGSLVFVVWGVGFAAFFISQVVPADPAAAALGNNARPAQVAAYREKRGLDKPAWQQYLIYMKALVTGDLGRSLRTQRPILNDLRDFFPATFELTLAAMLFALALGIPAGILAAVQQDRPLDLGVRALALVGGATPVYWLAILMLQLFHAKLGWLPGPGRLDAYLLAPHRVTGILTLLAQDWEVLVDALRHLLLPAVVLGAFSMALVARMVRSAMLETLSQDFVRTATAKGLPGRKVVMKHALRNAALPVLTVLGSLLGSLLTGAVLTETIFSWPGLGSYATASATALDFPAVMGVTLVAGLAYSLINLLVDVLYVVLDPRVSYV